MRWALAAVGVLGVSASGPLMAAIAAAPLAIAFWRNAMAAAVLAPFAVTTRREELRGLGRRELVLLVVAAVGLAAHFATWVWSLKLTSVASATSLVSAQVGFVVLIEWLRGERVPGRVLVGLLVAFAGVLVVSGVDITVSAEAVLGDALALLGGLLATIYILAGAELRQTMSTTGYTTICYGLCAVVLAPAALVAGHALGGYALSTWAGLVAVTVSAQLLGHSAFNYLLATMSPTVVSLVLLLEVPGASLLAAAFLGQAPPWGTYAGLVLVLAGLALVVSSRTPDPRTVEAGAY